MSDQITLPPPRTPDPLFDDFIPPRLLSLMRRVQRRGGRPTPLQHMLMIRLLKAIDPRLEPLVDDIVNRADGADGCIMVFMDLVGPEVAVGAVLAFKMLGASPEHIVVAWRLAEEKSAPTPAEGTALKIASRLLGASDQPLRVLLLDQIFADVSFFACD